MIKKIIALGIFLIGSISLTNAKVITDIGNEQELPGNNICSINSQLQINCNKSSNVLATTFTPANSLNGLFWTNGGIGMLFNEGGNTTQKLINDGFFICSGDMNTFISGSYSAGTTCTPGLEKIEIGNYNALINLFNGKTPKKRFHQQDNEGGTSIGLIFDNFYFYIGIGGYNDRITNGTGIEKDFGFGNGTGLNEINRNNINVLKTPNGGSNYRIEINTQCPTIGQVMANMGNNYNTGLCYNNTRYFNGNTFETIEQQDIFTIFNNDYENYNNRVSIYQQTCRPPATQQACQTAFSGEYKKYSIIDNAYNSNVDRKQLRNYCNMGLNYDPNTSTCIASGYIKEEYTPEERLESIIGTVNTIPTPNINTGSIFNTLCNEGDENCYQINRNFFDSLMNIYEKITNLFQKRNGVNGIIPDYILRITFIIILFTVIFKK